MKRVLLSVAALLSLSVSAAEVGMSISVGEPGFYGRIDIGDFPHPELVYRQPVIIKPMIGVVREPIYLHVPPGHARDWAKHCHQYNACGERVFFVHDRWYNDVYVPKYREHHRVASGKAKGRHKD